MLINYEIGIKFFFFDGYLIWNSVVYYEVFKNYQLFVLVIYFDGMYGFGFVNVGGKIKVGGLELELVYLQNYDCVMLVFLVILEKKLGIECYVVSNDYYVLIVCLLELIISNNCVDIIGNDLLYVLDVLLMVIYEYDFVFGNGVWFILCISLQYQSVQWLSWFNFGNGDKQKVYVCIDLVLCYFELGDKWYINVYVQNVSDGWVKSSVVGSILFVNGMVVFILQYLLLCIYGVQFGFWF